MKVLVVGSGGREHAICYCVAKSEKADKIYCAPGNAGISALAECVPIGAMEFDKLVAFAKEQQIDLVIVGMDDPLVGGLVDELEAAGIRTFGPRKNAAILEGSKAFSKDLMKKYNIPTAAYENFTNPDKALAYLETAKFPIVLKADGLAAHAFMTSAISSAAALLSWMFIDMVNDKKTTLVGASTGLVLGLVAITPGAGFVPIWASFIIGALVSPICYYGVILVKKKLKIDDALDAFGCHGIGGIWGGIATGIFGKSSINSVAKWDGLVYGEWRLFAAQIEGILITIAIAVVGTLICVGIVRIFTPLRVTDREEKLGLDISQHGESAYPSFNGMDQ